MQSRPSLAVAALALTSALLIVAATACRGLPAAAADARDGAAGSRTLLGRNIGGADGGVAQNPLQALVTTLGLAAAEVGTLAEAYIVSALVLLNGLARNAVAGASTAGLGTGSSASPVFLSSAAANRSGGSGSRTPDDIVPISAVATASAAAASAAASPPGVAEGDPELLRLQIAQLQLSRDPTLRYELYDQVMYDADGSDALDGRTADDLAALLAGKLLSRRDADASAAAADAGAAAGTVGGTVASSEPAAAIEEEEGDGVQEEYEDEEVYLDSMGVAYEGVYDEAGSQGNDAYDMYSSAVYDLDASYQIYNAYSDEPLGGETVQDVLDEIAVIGAELYPDVFASAGDGVLDGAMDPALESDTHADVTEVVIVTADAYDADLPDAANDDGGAAASTADLASVQESDTSAAEVDDDRPIMSVSRRLLAPDRRDRDQDGRDGRDDTRRRRERPGPGPGDLPAQVWVPGVVRVNNDGNGNVKVRVGPLGSIATINAQAPDGDRAVPRVTPVVGSAAVADAIADRVSNPLAGVGVGGGFADGSFSAQALSSAVADANRRAAADGSDLGDFRTGSGLVSDFTPKGDEQPMQLSSVGDKDRGEDRGEDRDKPKVYVGVGPFASGVRVVTDGEGGSLTRVGPLAGGVRVASTGK
ncbi:hypothetical protein GPECTOR_7g1061 [Gonium pectorale]|uniref:Uncharacterized protein n=1 Tax=Gonium pectorale TaxID=33097 RepID=A0A150GTL3_GONPE|nr:hypothetical protein GPECTOR_7g1061 [Gonium pectorale]|eukprot:KXZ53169.1 hypothetical protein GPECTOR_7g1061 [Gonium pectorale]